MQLQHPIVIEFREEAADPKVPTSTISGWWVTCGDRFSEWMTYEEMLGLVAALTMPAVQDRRCLQWMKTQAQRDDERRRWEESRRRREAEDDSKT